MYEVGKSFLFDINEFLHTHSIGLGLERGQSAVEYLMTYGWMLLVVAVVGGAVFGITQSQSVDSISGFSGGDVTVDGFGVTGSDELGLDLRSASGSGVVVSKVNVSDSDTGDFVYKEFTGDNRVGVGSSKIFELPNVTRTDSSNVLNVEIVYDNGGLSNLSVSGTVSGSLELTGSGSYSGSPEGGHQPIRAGGGSDTVSASGAPSFSTAPSGDEYESSWVPVTSSSSVQNGFSYFFDETSDEEYYNVSEGFYVMKYEAKPYNNVSDSFDSNNGDVGHNTDYVPRSVAANKPWRDISFNDGDPENGYGAVQACQALDGQTDQYDVHLVTNREWMTVARQIEQTDSNWVSDPQQSTGQLIRGNSDASDPYNASTDDSQGLYNLPSGGDDDLNERTFDLANGGVVWDWAGNVRQWVYAEDSGGSSTNGVFDSNNPGGLEYEKDPAVVDRSTNGVGGEYDFNSGDAALRGGNWGDSFNAGVFRAYSRFRGDSFASFGFRCSAVPVS